MVPWVVNECLGINLVRLLCFADLGRLHGDGGRGEGEERCAGGGAGGRGRIHSRVKN